MGGGIGKFNLNVVNKAASICKQPHRIQVSSTRGIGSEGPSPTPSQIQATTMVKRKNMKLNSHVNVNPN